MRNKLLTPAICLWIIPVAAYAQGESPIAKLSARLDEMEQQNKKMAEELRALREELAAYKSGAKVADTTPVAEPPLDERLQVEEQRTAEQAQTKVEASQKMPLSITGMLLFNAFSNGTHSGTAQYPVVAAQAAGMRSAGASLRQTVLGLSFDGPQLPWDGKVSGSLYMDFFAGSALPSNQLLHIRVATMDLSWKNTTITLGQDKPLIAPREPDSLAQVGVSPLTAAGNLWDWQPQVRVERHFQFGEDSGFRAQGSIYQTSELDNTVPAAYASTLERARPGYEARGEFWIRRGVRRFEIAPGIHASTTHVAGTSVPSRIFSLDGLFRPISFLQFTGAYFEGRNAAGLGAMRQGFSVLSPGNAIPVHSVGGWAQMALFPTSRLTFHFYGGQQHDRAADLLLGGIKRNFTYAGNLIYRFAPNVLGSLEASQTRTTYLNVGTRLNVHYDLALAYLF